MMTSGQDTFHVGSGISHFEQLCHSLEFENHQYVKMIEDENQRITALKTKIQEKTEQTQRKNEDISKMDELIKQLHKRFTWCKDNLKCLENTRSIIMDHTTALSKELDIIKSKGMEERKTYDEQVAKYSSIREDYLSTYQSFPLAIELTKKKEELTHIQEKEAEVDSLIKALCQKKEEKEAFLDKKVLARQVIKLAKLKIADMSLEKEIHKCVVDKTRLLEQLKEIQGSKDQQMDNNTQEHQESNTTENTMDIDEVTPNEHVDITSQKNVHQSNSVEMIPSNEEKEPDDSSDKAGAENQGSVFQINLSSDFKQKNTLNDQNVDKPHVKETMTPDTTVPTTIGSKYEPDNNYEPIDQNLNQRSYSRPKAASLFIPRFSFGRAQSQPPKKPMEVKDATTRQPVSEEAIPKSTLKIPTLPRFSFQTSFATTEKTHEKPVSPPKPKPVSTQSSTRPSFTLSMPKFSSIPKKKFIDSTDSFKLNLSSKPEPRAQAPRQTFSMSKFSKSENIQPKVSSHCKQTTNLHTDSTADDPTLHSVVPGKPGNEIRKDAEAHSSQKDKSVDDDGDEKDQPVFKLTPATEPFMHSSPADFTTAQASPSSSFNLFNSRESRYSSSRDGSDYHPFAFGDVGDSPQSQHGGDFASNLFSLFPMQSHTGTKAEGGGGGGSGGGFKFSFVSSSDNEGEETVASLLNLNPVRLQSNIGQFRLDANFDKDEDEGRPMFNLF